MKYLKKMILAGTFLSAPLVSLADPPPSFESFVCDGSESLLHADIRMGKIQDEVRKLREDKRKMMQTLKTHDVDTRFHVWEAIEDFFLEWLQIEKPLVGGVDAATDKAHEATKSALQWGFVREDIDVTILPRLQQLDREYQQSRRFKEQCQQHIDNERRNNGEGGGRDGGHRDGGGSGVDIPTTTGPGGIDHNPPAGGGGMTCRGGMLGGVYTEICDVSP